MAAGAAIGIYREFIFFNFFYKKLKNGLANGSWRCH